DVIVQSAGDSVVDAEVELDVPGTADIPSQARVTRSGAVQVIRSPDAGDECDRALVLADKNEVLITADQQGSGQANLCAIADTITSGALAVLNASGVPDRRQALPRASLASLNACSLLGASALGKVPGIVAGQREPGFAGWDCSWDSPLD